MEDNKPLYKRKSSLTLDIDIINEEMSKIKYKKTNFVDNLKNTVNENKNSFVNKLRILVKENKIEN